MMSEAVATQKVPCPNPVCDGFVAPDQKQCLSCGDSLGPCPNCRALISNRIGSCGQCGYPDKSAEATTSGTLTPSVGAGIISSTTAAIAPTVISYNATRSAITGMFANAYAQVAGADGDMRDATRELEEIRTWLLTERDGLRVWRLLNEKIGHADPESLQPALIELRTEFKRQLFDQQTNRLLKSFDADPAGGWSEWLRTFAEALVFWRLTLCQHLVDAPLPFPDHFHAPHDFRKSLRLALHERWTEIFKFFLFLGAHEFLHSQTRARLLITAGQIHLYYFPQPERALKLFQQADSLSPDTGRVIAALGDYYLRQDDLETARTYLERALAAAPEEVEGYIYLGDLSDRQGRLEEAINWYQEAINKVGGDGLGYTRLLRAYGRAEMIGKYEWQIEPLAKRAVAIDETGQYRVYLDVGDAYLSAKRFDTAQAKYQEAIDLEPGRLDGYTWKGFGYLDEGESRFENARQAFARAIEVAPEAYDGYWGMSQLCERQGNRTEAIGFFREVAQKRPELQTSMLSRIGQMQRELGEFEGAEATLFEALEIDGSTEAALLELADDYYRNQEKTDQALNLFKRIRDHQGESFEAAYQNRLGNVDFYGERNQEAAEHYLKAIQSDSRETIYYSNLAKAYGRLQRWTEAHEQLQKAFEIDGDRQKYDSEAALAYNDEGNVAYGKGDFARAAECYQKAIETDGKDATYYSNLAEAYAGLRRWSEAREQLQKATALDSGEEKYKPKIALTYNEEGNFWFAQGDFERAINNYDDAAALFPESPRYASNRALALERLAANSPEFRSLLDRAITDARAATERAQVSGEWSAQSGEFSELLEKLERERNLVDVYGPIVLNLNPKDDAIRISVGNDIAAIILNAEQTDLAPDFMERISSLRDRISDEHGLAIPVFNFTPLPVVDPTANYELRVNGEVLSYARLDLQAENGQEELKQRIELDLLPHLDKLCGHQETANQLKLSDAKECAETLNDALKLHALSARLKELLSNGAPIADLPRICREINQTPDDRKPVAPATALTNESIEELGSIKFFIGENSSLNQSELNAALIGTQTLVFNIFGVTIPQPAISTSAILDANDFEMQFDEQKPGPTKGLAPGELWVQTPLQTIVDEFPAAQERNYGEQEGCVIVDSEAVRHELEGQYNLLDPINFLTFCFALQIRQRISTFLTTQIVSHYLALIADDYPDLLRVARSFFTVEMLTQRLRALLQAEISIRNIPAALESFLSVAQQSEASAGSGQAVSELAR
jgi:tetratricopeptide (TPR) repeat protein